MLTWYRALSPTLRVVSMASGLSSSDPDSEQESPPRPSLKYTEKSRCERIWRTTIVQSLNRYTSIILSKLFHTFFIKKNDICE